MAGIPEDVLRRAKEILDNLEGAELDEVGRPRLAHASPETDKGDFVQLNLFSSEEGNLLELIRKLDISSMTPLEALLELNKLKEYIDSRT